MILSSPNLHSQTQDNGSDEKDSLLLALRTLETEIPELSERVTISVSGTTINEFIRAIANSTGVNLSIDPSLVFQVVNNFNDVKVVDVLLFLAEKYDLRITSIGNIIVINPPETRPVPKKIFVSYDSISSELSIDVEDVDLSTVARKITEATGTNIIPGIGAGDQKIKSFISGLKLQSALDKIAFSNNLALKSSDDGTYLLEKKVAEKPDQASLKPDPNQQVIRPEKSNTFKMNVSSVGGDSISVFAEQAPISELIKEVSQKSGINFILVSVPKGEVTLYLSGTSFIEFLKVLLTGTDHVYRKAGDGIFIIGNKNLTELMEQEVVELQYRAIDSLLSVIPEDILADVETTIFVDQNSVLLSGPIDKVRKAGTYIRMLDKLIPVISIEVMIIDYNSSFTVSTGIQAGITNSEVPPTSGTVLPSVDLNLNSQSINDLIRRFNGFGWANLGYVTPSFYASIKAMENQGILSVSSTPVLSTLNGHKTEMSIGNTEYYLEEQVNIIGTDNPQSYKTQTYKSVNAELSIIITPVVSGDDQITLEIEVQQSDFTERISTTAPPGKVTRTFKSKIRVRNGEMILLGGLEEKRDNKTSTGVPILSRIPIIRRLFSQRTEDNSKSRLNIFIKPTIIN